MDGRAFLQVARELALGATEAHWRSAAGRAYYALLLEVLAALERWGFTRPPRHQVHAFARLRFTYSSDSDLRRVGFALDELTQRRNEADYQIASYGSFADATEAMRVIREAEVNLARLDQVEADVLRRTAAIAGIRAKWP
jgi:uncharacterized protein (UPF0332 family)